MGIQLLAARAQNLRPFHFLGGGLLAAALAAPAAQVNATPLLRCYVSYAGSTQLVEASPGSDPYATAAVDIGGRFRFKAVMAGSRQTIDYIKLYAYFQTRHADIPIHQATYLPPFAIGASEQALTPQNSLYAGEVERELQYRCTLQQVQP